MRLRNGKRNGSGCVPGGISVSSSPCSATSLPQVAVLAWIDTSRPVPTTAIGRPAAAGVSTVRSARRPEHVEDAVVGEAVDALRESGHDVHAGRGQTAPELASHRSAGRRGVAGADDRRPVVRRAAPRSPRRTARAAGAGRRRGARVRTATPMTVTVSPSSRQRSHVRVGLAARRSGATPPGRVVAQHPGRRARREGGAARPVAIANACSGSWWRSSASRRGTVIRRKRRERGRVRLRGSVRRSCGITSRADAAGARAG